MTGDFVKILIVGFAKIKYMPYLNLYLENIDREKNNVHLVYWNRDLKEEDMGSLHGITLHEYKRFQEDEVSKLSKVGSFVGFRRFTEKVMKEGFDFVVVIHSIPAVILSTTLLKSYKERYIFDYRDFTYEAIAPYKRVIHALVKNSYKTFVSSDAFRKYLPQNTDKILTTHNILTEDTLHKTAARYEPEGGKIRVGFWGFIRQEDINVEIIKRFSQDDRFELHYYGREQKTARDLKEYVKDNNIRNVFFHGEYNPDEKVNIIRNTDIVHNVYENKTTRLAMGNKYYDGVVFEKPQICMQGSFMGEQAEKSGVGCKVSLNSKTFTQDIYDYYTGIDMARFKENCRKEKERILAENERVKEVIRKIKN